MQDKNTIKMHFTYPERSLIKLWKIKIKNQKNKEKKSNREIAKLLCKVPQIIHNKIKRSRSI